MAHLNIAPEYIVKNSGRIEVKFHNKPRVSPNVIPSFIINEDGSVSRIAYLIGRNEQVYDVCYVDKEYNILGRVESMFHYAVGRPYQTLG